jgi:acetyl-CoA carboxylase, biotin carboxylase subunit
MGRYISYSAKVTVFRKVLVANRGEIAVRVVRTLREMGIASVATYSNADRGSLAVRLADEAAYVGASPSSESYLRIDRVIDAAKHHGAEAIHPGYGFLSENAEFAEACAAAGIVFIGPPAEAIRKLGSKTAARQLAIAAGAPVVPGTERALSGWEEARSAANVLGYPVLLKASAGGGGKGMRRVDGESDLQAALRDAASEAGRAFGNSEVYIEKLVEEPRHIEIQILGDRHGHLIHLGERECSIQRRHQKVIEECPSPLMAQHPELREKMAQAALNVARAAGYTNAGTVEFLVDDDVDHGANFYFLEVNTRLQVEHPVTELATGLDLVEWQLRIAAGERLTLEQKDITWRGSAIECRIYAEDPDREFMPSPGRILHLSEPSGPGIRLDSGIFEGWNVPLEYDPLLAKLAAWGPTRDAAIHRLDRALSEYILTGVRNNIAFFREVLADAEFRSGRLSTSFLDRFFKSRMKAEDDPEAEAAAALAMALEESHHSGSPLLTHVSSHWLESGREDLLR